MSCHDLISDETIKSIYSIEGITPEIKKSHCVDSKYPKDEPGGNWLIAKEVLLDIKKENKSLLQNCCIANEYCKTATEKIVILNNIRLHNDNKRQGLGRKIHLKQHQIYKESGFSRIVLKAVSDGVVVWNKLGFNFKQNTDKHMILSELRKYLKEIKSIEIKYKDLRKVPKNMIFDQKKDFSVWLEEKGISNISMLLELKDV